jgi:uncharacterized DUF497 family protein
MYAWDEDKRRKNITKHGVDFASMATFDWDRAAFAQGQIVGSERREVLIGLIGAVLHVVVYSERGKEIRIISMRKANRHEIAHWLRLQHDS